MNTVLERSTRFSLLLTACCVAACTAQAPAGVASEEEALESVNGLTSNGFRMNGLTLNGFRMNGLSLNGPPK